jgi:glycosyltransferase involved in cell wall biosynthesis
MAGRAGDFPGGFKVVFFNEVFDGRKWWFHEVGKIPPQKWELSLRDGFPNEVLGTAQGGLWSRFRILRDCLRREKPSAVVIYGYYLPEHWILRLLCGRMNVPIFFVGETYSETTSFLRRMVKRPLRSYFFEKVSRFIAIGRKSEAYYRELGIAPERIIGAKYCTDVSFFLRPSDEAAEIRRRWRMETGIPQDAFVLLFVGRLFERKRPSDMIALHQRLTRHANVHTVLVGNGPLEPELRALGIDQSRLVFAGFRNQAQTREAYYGADLLVVPSVYETWGLVVNEAFACACPAMVTETCGTAGDLVVPGKTGEVFPVGDIEAAARGVERLLAQPGLRRQWGEQARQKVRAEYDVGQFADALGLAFQATLIRGSFPTPEAAHS